MNELFFWINFYLLINLFFYNESLTQFTKPILFVAESDSSTS